MPERRCCGRSLSSSARLHYSPMTKSPVIQAIATTAPDLPPKPGTHAAVHRDHEYKCLGTLTLSAAVDLVSCLVHHKVTQQHRSREFVANSRTQY